MTRMAVTWRVVAAVLGHTLTLAVSARPGAAQQGTTSEATSRLRPDGNGQPALRAIIDLSLDGVSVTRALQTIAEQARLNLTFDPQLPGLDGRVRVLAGPRSVADALLLVIARAGLAIDVTSSGQLIVRPFSDTRDLGVAITGRVLDSASRPVRDATVDVRGTLVGARTDANGSFAMRTLTAGRLIVRAHRLGYRDAESVLAATLGDSVHLELRLAETALTLAPVRTEDASPRRARFEDRPNVSTLSLGGADIRSTPRLIEADVMRAVRLLPGVSARNDYTAALNVRGGESDQNLILLDGYPIYNPFHLGGLFSTFIAPTVGEVTLLAGGFPSPYGGRLSSVLDVHSADESRTGVHGTADVSLLSSSVSLSGARDDGRGSWMIAGRRTYLDAIVDIVKPGGVPYHFSDLQGRLTRRLPGGVQFSTTAYAGLDLLHTASSTYDESRFAWGNEVLGATLTKTVADNPSVAGIPLGARVALEQRVSTSRFHTGLATNISSIAIHSDVNDLRAAGSATAYTARHDRTVGYEVAGIRTTYASNAALPGLQFDSVRQRSRVASGYYDDLWRVSPALLLQVGARIDAVQAAGVSISPRLSAKYLLTPDLALTAATGRYVQAVHSLGREDIPIRVLDFWIASDSALPVSTAWHYTVGLERRITPLRTLRVETFYRTFDHLLDANLLADPGVPGDEFVVSHGRSYGVDVLLQQFEYKRFSGWLSYTYALSSRVDAEGRHFFPGQDRRHDFNAVASWRGERYAFAARFGLASGTPYTNVLGDFARRRYDPLTQAFTDGSTNDKEYLTGARNGERLPLTHRLDVSLLRVPRPGRVSVSPYLSIVNAYSARNTIAYLFNYAPSPPVRTPIPGFPIVPSVGVNIAW
ncbi:MAG: TonB-dependent receptor [bacterium]